jgi:hypothetical protein
MVNDLSSWDVNREMVKGVYEMKFNRRQFVGLVATAPTASLVAGCSNLEREPPAPQGLESQVTVLGIPNARFWPDTQSAEMAKEVEESVRRERAATGKTVTDGPLPPAHFLALSGGGDDGPFGAGLLSGWRDAGTIPTFKLVTGVSTGSMIAPLAFLGQPYADRIRTMYTTIKPDNIMEKQGLYGAVFGDARLMIRRCYS